MGFTHQLRNGGNDDVESSQSSNRSRAIIADCWLWMSVSSNEAGAVRLLFVCKQSPCYSRSQIGGIIIVDPEKSIYPVVGALWKDLSSMIQYS